MKQVSIRKRLSVLGLAFVMSVMAQSSKHPEGTLAPFSAGPNVAGVTINAESALAYPPGPSVDGNKHPEGPGIIAI
jgi:hypothetical protein